MEEVDYGMDQVYWDVLDSDIIERIVDYERDDNAP